MCNLRSGLANSCVLTITHPALLLYIHFEKGMPAKCW